MAVKDDEALLSLNEKQFILDSIKTGLRTDGRKLIEQRQIRVTLNRKENESSAEVQLGRTRVFAVVTAEIVPPFPDRPTDGFLQFSVDLSPMASASYESGRPSTQSIEISRIIERGFKDSRALDTEALCLIAGEKVWAVKCTIHVLDDGGNVVDAIAFATSAALLHFRMSEVTISNGKVQVHSIDEREPVPLSLHHIPLCITFGIVQSDEENLPESSSYLILDPSSREEMVVNGRLTLTLNKQQEICAIHQASATPVDLSTLSRSLRIAASKVQELSDHLSKTEQEEDKRERESRRSRLRGQEAVYATIQQLDSTREELVANDPEMKEAMDFSIVNTTVATKERPKQGEATTDLKTLPLLKAAAEATERAAENAATRKTGSSESGSLEAHFLDSRRPMSPSDRQATPAPAIPTVKPSSLPPKRENKSKKTPTAAKPTESDSEEETTIVLHALEPAKPRVPSPPTAREKEKKTDATQRRQMQPAMPKQDAAKEQENVEDGDSDDLLSAVRKTVKKKKASKRTK